MSAQVHEVDSVMSVELCPDNRWVVETTERFEDGSTLEQSLPVLGFATVVARRDMWVVRTDIQPVVVCCDRADPIFVHIKHLEHRWEWKLVRA